MVEMLGYCGLLCNECPTYLATQANDDKKRDEIAAEWSDLYGKNYTRKDINCDGCLTEGGRLFSHCTQCEIRACAQEKKLINCASCKEFPCDKQTELYEVVPDAKNRLLRERPTEPVDDWLK